MPRKLFDKFLNRPEETYVRPSLERSDSIESIASDATAPNLPGPGRNVGRLYDALGSKFERFLSNTAGVGRESGQSDAQLSLQLVRTDSPDSIASDATGPNNPGPGRNLGRLLDAVGGRVENLLNGRAGRLKLGPDAVAEEIRTLRRYNYTSTGRKILGFPGIPTDEEHVALKKLCRRLLKHCR